jgi:16S rRNA processing protein RimM
VVPAEGAPSALEVERARPSGPGAIVRFAGVQDRTAAEALRGARVLVERADLPPLAPGEYYLADLVGLRVQGPEGPVGEVVEVNAYPSVVSISVRLADGRLAEQPLGPHWVVRVSVAEGTLELSTLDGLAV